MTPLIGVYADGALHFCTGPEEQKARNIAANPAVLMSTGANTLHAGLDVAIEGTATPVTDDARLRAGRGVGGQVRRRMALRCRRRRVRPSGGRAEVFRVEPAQAYAFGETPTATPATASADGAATADLQPISGRSPRPGAPSGAPRGMRAGTYTIRGGTVGRERLRVRPR